MWTRISSLASTFEKAAKAKPIYLYHGTSMDVLPSIMSQGLIPNPKKRVWGDDPDASFYMPSRQSLPSIYLTSNLLTALGSGFRNRAGPPGPVVLVMVVMQSQSLAADEDALPQLNKIISYSNFMAAVLYISAKLSPDESVQNAKKDYIDSNLGYLSRDLAMPLNAQLKERITNLLEEGFVIALKRIVSHVDDWDWNRALSYFAEGKTLPKPTPAEAERDFKAFQDQMTRTLKIMARPNELTNLFNFTARSNEPIGFTKSNHIVAVFIRPPYEKDQRSYLKLVYPDSEEQIPREAMSKLYLDWERSVGPELDIVDK